MSRKEFVGVQLSTVFNIVPLVETNLYANLWIYFLILRCSSMLVKFSITDAFALAAVLWLKSQVSMICIQFIAYAKYQQTGIESKLKNPGNHCKKSNCRKLVRPTD